MTLFENLTDTGRDAFEVIARRPDVVLVAIDFDGTLAPIVADPERAFPDPQALAALGRLGSLVGQVAIITGRPARTAVSLGGLAQVPGLERLVVLGQYGVERWDAATGTFEIPPVPAAIEDVADELPLVLAQAGQPDARIEHKQRAIAVHTRQLPDPEGAYSVLADPVTELAARHGLQVEPGRFVLEIRAASADKGDALNELVAEVGAEVVVYAGDDLGDIPAFRAVRGMGERGLVGIGVYAASEEQPALRELADVSCEATPGVAAWLDAAADAIEVGSHQRGL
ncbi:MAG: trehalose-phosphatase [Brooklawnia sp.]|uniref:trehalose-phosphatase n=1 Tax=Brooklawnia sp. TaxID=2699740 RepID=UPI003C72B9CB